jgi:serine protease Do
MALAAQSVSPQAGDASIPGQPFVAIAKQAKASVVNISSAKKTARGAERFPSPFFEDPFFRRFFGEQFEGRMPAPREHREQPIQ